MATASFDKKIVINKNMAERIAEDMKNANPITQTTDIRSELEWTKKMLEKTSLAKRLVKCKK